MTTTAPTLLDGAPWTGRILLDEWSTSTAGTSEVREPATGDLIGQVGRAGLSDVTRATGVALRAQAEWAALPYVQRATVLRTAGDLFLQHTPEIAGWLAREAGSAPMKAATEAPTAAGDCYEAASLASAAYGEVLRSAQPRLSFSRHVPVGIVAVITPFNVPLALAVRAVAPALALGNAVVLKPDLRTAVSGGVLLARIFEEAGLPPGVLTMLPGGAEVGEALVTDPHVRVISFTGSTRAGRAVAVSAARHLKRVHLELGGNSGLIVMGDVDVSAASSLGAFGSFFHQGQVCMTTGRHIVHRDIADAYVDNLAARADKLVVGDPHLTQPDLGPIIDRHQRDRIHGLVTETVDLGARLVSGGRYDGLYYRPTVLADVSPDAPAATEEIFGPVAPVLTFSTEEEAIELACRSPYGLSLGILSSNVAAAMELAARIPVGMVHINDQTLTGDATSPFGGMGDSGNGSRHGGTRANLESFTETQWTTVRGDLPVYPF